jgi:hypothetical protein
VLAFVSIDLRIAVVEAKPATDQVYVIYVAGQE